MQVIVHIVHARLLRSLQLPRTAGCNHDMKVKCLESCQQHMLHLDIDHHDNHYGTAS